MHLLTAVHKLLQSVTLAIGGALDPVLHVSFGASSETILLVDTITISQTAVPDAALESQPRLLKCIH